MLVFFCHYFCQTLLISVLDTVGAQYGQSGEDAVCVSKVWVPFYEKHFSVRHLDGGMTMKTTRLTERGCEAMQ